MLLVIGILFIVFVKCFCSHEEVQYWLLFFIYSRLEWNVLKLVWFTPHCLWKTGMVTDRNLIHALLTEVKYIRKIYIKENKKSFKHQKYILRLQVFEVSMPAVVFEGPVNPVRCSGSINPTLGRQSCKDNHVHRLDSTRTWLYHLKSHWFLWHTCLLVCLQSLFFIFNVNKYKQNNK